MDRSLFVEAQYWCKVGHSLKSTLRQDLKEVGWMLTPLNDLKMDTGSYSDYNVQWISSTKHQEQFLIGYSQYVQ